MKPSNRSFLYSFLTIIITLLMPYIIPSSAFSYDLPGWYNGAVGFEDASSTSRKNETPVILFFYKESEELSQKLKDDYFSKYEVYSFLDDILKVGVDLEGNDFDKALAKKYNQEQEPALLVTFPFSETKPVKITPFGEEKDMSPQEFIDNLKNIFSITYSDIGYGHFNNQEYDRAIKSFKLSIKYNPKRAYPVFAIGSVYHAMAVEEKNKDYLDKAEENYLKAIKLDPECKECKEELQKLQENRVKISGK
jgi:tetratricopeptide (TPR) repeat protein